METDKSSMMEHQPATPRGRDDRRRSVADAVWRWKVQQHPQAFPSRRVSTRVLRDVVIGLVMAAALYAAGRPVLAGVAAVVSLVVLAVRAVLPPSLSAPVISFAGRVAHQAGRALTAVVLGAVYCTVFVPLRVWRTLTGHDTLRLKRRRAGETFWIDRSTLPRTSPEKPY